MQPVRLTSEPEWVEEHKQNKEEEQDKEEDQLQKAIELSLREQVGILIGFSHFEIIIIFCISFLLPIYLNTYAMGLRPV